MAKMTTVTLLVHNADTQTFTVPKGQLGLALSALKKAHQAEAAPLLGLAPKRRGRPPKAQSAAEATPAAQQAPKRRGRPPKALAPVPVEATAPPKRRGRPRKADVTMPPAQEVAVAPKRRGRPPKAKAVEAPDPTDQLSLSPPELAETALQKAEAVAPAPKRRRRTAAKAASQAPEAAHANGQGADANGNGHPKGPVTGDAAKLVAARAKAELSQAELAEKANIHKTDLCRMERGKRPISPATIKRLNPTLGEGWLLQ